MTIIFVVSKMLVEVDVRWSCHCWEKEKDGHLASIKSLMIMTYGEVWKT